jgi:hypothetical protein
MRRETKFVVKSALIGGELRFCFDPDFDGTAVDPESGGMLRRRGSLECMADVPLTRKKR